MKVSPVTARSPRSKKAPRTPEKAPELHRLVLQTTDATRANLKVRAATLGKPLRWYLLDLAAADGVDVSADRTGTTGSGAQRAD